MPFLIPDNDSDEVTPAPTTPPTPTPTLGLGVQNSAHALPKPSTETHHEDYTQPGFDGTEFPQPETHTPSNPFNVEKTDPLVFTKSTDSPELRAAAEFVRPPRPANATVPPPTMSEPSLFPDSPPPTIWSPGVHVETPRKETSKLPAKLRNVMSHIPLLLFVAVPAAILLASLWYLSLAGG